MGVSLHKKHPNLFRMILLVAVSNLTIASFVALDSPKASISFTRILSIGLVHHPIFWVTLFTVSGILLLLGSFGCNKYMFARIGLVMSAGIGSFLALGFWLSYFSGNVVGVSAPVIWTFYTFVCIINSSEPTVNPLSATLQQNIHTTLQDETHTNGVNNVSV
jgi:hypothetical protein